MRDGFLTRQLEEAGSRELKEENWEGKGSISILEEGDAWEDVRSY